MDLPRVTTPEAISPELLAFAKSIAPEYRPKYLKVEPDKKAELNRCIQNVLHVVERRGGYPVLGWTLWENRYLFQAVYHAVWLTPNMKSLIDVTPRQFGERMVLFLPQMDPDNLSRDQKDPHFQAKIDVPEVRYMLETLEFRWELEQKFRDPITWVSDIPPGLVDFLLLRVGISKQRVIEFLEQDEIEKCL